jgi:hypothetical protein
MAVTWARRGEEVRCSREQLYTLTNSRLFVHNTTRWDLQNRQKKKIMQ